jgi:hypothetical protein
LRLSPDPGDGRDVIACRRFLDRARADVIDRPRG